MDKIVDFEKRVLDKKRQENRDKNRQKIQSLHRIVQCSACHLRCAMCGIQSQVRDPTDRMLLLTRGFSLCEDCREEYEDFAAPAGDRESRDLIWHNKEWYRMWSAWLEYRRALKAFRESAEYKRMLKELDR